jgi:Fe2+ transport system protein B
MYEIFEQPMYIKWNSFRQSDDARYVGMCMPRFLLRTPYTVQNQDVKDFVFEAFPIIVVGNFVVYLANVLGLLNVVQWVLSPVTVLWLGLPAATGIVLIFGVLRKEMTLILLATIMGTTNFALVLSPAQMFVLREFSRRLEESGRELVPCQSEYLPLIQASSS